MSTRGYAACFSSSSCPRVCFKSRVVFLDFVILSSGACSLFLALVHFLLCPLTRNLWFLEENCIYLLSSWVASDTGHDVDDSHLGEHHASLFTADCRHDDLPAESPLDRWICGHEHSAH